MKATIDLNGLSYNIEGLIPAIIQQFDTKEVLMLGYMDQEALERTVETNTTWFWKRKKQRYWNKGRNSGRIQIVKSIMYDCDMDALLVLVDDPGPTCHTGNRSCFYRSLLND